METFARRNGHPGFLRTLVLATTLFALFVSGSVRAPEAEATVNGHYAKAVCRTENSLSGNSIRVVDGIYATRAGDIEWTRIRIWAYPESGGQWSLFRDTGWKSMQASVAGWNYVQHSVASVPHGFFYQVQVFHGSLSGNRRVAPMLYVSELGGYFRGVVAGQWTNPDYCYL